VISALLVSLVLTASDAGVLLSKPVTVSADKLDYLKKESRAVYRGHAVAKRDGMTMTCDELEAFFAPSGEIQRIVARGNVHAIDESKPSGATTLGESREAWGDEAEFINETGVLTVKGNPRGKQGPREVEGEVVTFTTGIDRVVVTKAHTRVKEPKDQRVSIDADLLTLEGEKNEAKWTGHVKAVKAKTLLLAPELTATYDEQGEINRVLARGGVEVTEGDRWARGQNADYDVAKGMLVVTGKPQARQGKTRMTGTRVTFFSGSEFLEVENAKTVIEVEKNKPERSRSGGTPDKTGPERSEDPGQGGATRKKGP
jgi:lipopolysaccharide export system protein LptA